MSSGPCSVCPLPMVKVFKGFSRMWLGRWVPRLSFSLPASSQLQLEQLHFCSPFWTWSRILLNKMFQDLKKKKVCKPWDQITTKMLRLLPYSAGGANFDFWHSVFLSFQNTLYVYVQIARSSPVHGLMFIECFLWLGLLCILIYSICSWWMSVLLFSTIVWMGKLRHGAELSCPRYYS